jgi:ATP-dependent Zn protease
LSPRGQALGFVRHNPLQDQYLYTRSFLEERIMIALGGSVAEEMFYGSRSTGSRNDFQQALGMVETMIDSGLTSLGIVDRSTVSPEQLMKENASILDQLTIRTRDLLEQYRGVFLSSLQILLEEEVLSGDQFRQLMV